MQCKVHLRRSSSTGPTIKYEAEIFDYKGVSKGKKNVQSPTKSKPLVMDGLNPQVKIWGKDDSQSLKDIPNYQADNVEWTNDKKGRGGKYCEVGDVDGDHKTRDEDCYFPCFIK